MGISICPLHFNLLPCSDERTNPDGVWYDGKTGRLWGQIKNSTLQWWDGIKSKIVLEKPDSIHLPLRKGVLKGRITEKGLIEWEDGAIWRLGNANNTRA